jgi:hypothetical protein
MMLSKKLRKWVDPVTGNEGLAYWCQGCKRSHNIRIKGPGAWGWNGDAEKPVFTPSVLTTNGHYVPSHKPGDPCWCTYVQEHPDEADDTFTCHGCHTFVGCNGAQPGEVIFLGDCTHELAGQVLPLPDLPQYMQEQESPS